MKDVSVFLPVYNEASILSTNIREVISALNKLKLNYEVVVVDDGSNDSTESICKELILKNKNIVYKKYDNGPSRRENLAKSFKDAKSDLVLFMDIDLATDINHLSELINYIKKDKFDISIGSRYSGIKSKREISRLIISIIYNKIMQLFFNSKIKDHQCGFKAFKKEVILDLVNELGYDYSFKRGWLWDTEMLIMAQKKGYKIKEFPVKWICGEYSSFNLKRELKILSYMMKLRKKLKNKTKEQVLLKE